MGWPAAHLFRANSTGLVLLPTRPFATDDPLPPLPHPSRTPPDGDHGPRGGIVEDVGPRRGATIPDGGATIPF